MSTLNTLCNTLKPTDELIALNKHYQKLNVIYDKIEELQDLIYDLDELDLKCANGEIQMLAKKGTCADRGYTGEMLGKLQAQILYELSHTGYKAREIFSFQKLAKAIRLYKAIKDKPNEES